MERKALFLDMDGTTLNDEIQIPKENYEAMEAAAKAGHEIVITTGRPYASARGLLKKWDLERIGLRYIIAFNGGLVLDAVTGEILYQKTIPLPLMRTAVQKARKAGLYIQTYEGDYVIADEDGECLHHYTHKTGMMPKVLPDLYEGMHEEACKMLAIDLHDFEKIVAFRKDDAWTKGQISMCFSCREYLEILPTGVEKGEALKAFCKRLEIPIANSLAAGDENNDISMIKAAGTGCAVANARPEVKAAADYVTLADNNQGAIREIIEKFML